MNSPNLTTVLLPPAKGRSIGRIRAAQPLGACPGGRAPRQNWGKFEAHKWGGFTARLDKAPERLAGLRTAEGTGLPANIIEEFRRDMERLALVREQISSIEKTRAERLERAPDTGPHAMVRLLARVIGIGIETADMLVREVLSRKLRDRRAVARYAGLTGSPDESGLKRREKGLARAGNARVRRGLIQLAWRFLMFQKDSALARVVSARGLEAPSGARKTTMIVALARKLLIALWRLVTTGEVPDGVELRPADVSNTHKNEKGQTGLRHLTALDAPGSR